MRRLTGLSIFAVITVCLAGPLRADPYDYGTDNPPPVVYRRVRVQPRAYYEPPPWAAPSAAALAPWPWSFEFGGGPTVVSGSNSQLNNGTNFVIGGGYNFSPHVGLNLEFMNSWHGLTDQALADHGAFDGGASIWSMTLNPIYRFRLGGPVGAYITGGGGFYEREERFDEQQQVVDPFFGPVLIEQEIRQTTDAGGLNVGMGLTCNLGWGTKFFVEARYHHVFTGGDGTDLIPVTFGLRW